MSARMKRVLVLAAVVLVAACGAIPRDAACVAAEKCDNALQEPFGSFAATDPQFGDNLNGDDTAGQFGDVGTCWQSADTAKPCIAQCKQFVKEQHDIAAANNDQGVLDACPDAAAN
jgi:hypothetical protein